MAAPHSAGDRSRLEIILQLPRATSCTQPHTLLLGGTPPLPKPLRAPPAPLPLVLVALVEGSCVVTAVPGAELTFLLQAVLSQYTGSLAARPRSEPHRCADFTAAVAVD